MRTWDEVLELVSVTKTDDGGGGSTETEVFREVYANRKSIRQSEFYQAQAAGLKPLVAFEIHSLEFGDEEHVRYPAGESGKRYRIIRTFSPDNEFIELYCEREVGT